jgi:hypothetical protein
MTNSIEWPTASRPGTPSKVLLPELELTDADYEAAAEALNKLDDCFFEVIFVHEVAARHCRERQLNAALARKSPTKSRSNDIINQWKTPTPITRFIPIGESNRAKK